MFEVFKKRELTTSKLLTKVETRLLEYGWTVESIAGDLGPILRISLNPVSRFINLRLSNLFLDKGLNGAVTATLAEDGHHLTDVEVGINSGSPELSGLELRLVEAYDAMPGAFYCHDCRKVHHDADSNVGNSEYGAMVKCVQLTIFHNRKLKIF